MACYKPLKAYQCADGSVVFSELRRFNTVRSLELPCGQCVGCRLERSRQWAMRCVHESKMHSANSFITLTYNDEHLPRDLSLDYTHFQLFMKRLRKRFPGSKIRFYMCGEYGENFGRPHYHACLFGFDFPDKLLLKRTAAGFTLYTSKVLEQLWGKGMCSVGDVSFESAAYVARYIMKKVTGDAAEAHYRLLDPVTGEVFQRVPEFNHMSLKPGIGAKWYEKFASDVFPHDYVVVNGKKVKPPKYYDKLFDKSDFFAADMVKFEREVDARDRFDDNTDERLAVREGVARARVERFARSIE